MKTRLHVAVATTTVALLGLTLLPTLQAQTTAVTKPVGYHTITVESNASFPVFNLTGANFAKKILAAGELDGVGTNTLDDAEATFTSAFSGVTYFDRDFGGPGGVTPNLVVEITSGPNVGLNTEVTSFSDMQLSTMDDLSGLASSGETYVVREALTVADIFGAANSAALNAGTGGPTVDKIWIPNGAGWDKLYYNDVAQPFPPIPVGWQALGNEPADAANLPIYFTDGFIVERVAPPNLNIVISGHVRVDPALVSLEFGFSAIDRLFPVGSTLDNCGLVPDDDGGTPGDPSDDVPTSDGLTFGNSGSADIVWMQKPGNNGWNKYFYQYPAVTFPPIPAGWQLLGAEGADRGAVELTPGIIVERRTAGKNVLITADPAIYDNL